MEVSDILCGQGVTGREGGRDNEVEVRGNTSSYVRVFQVISLKSKCFAFTATGIGPKADEGKRLTPPCPSLRRTDQHSRFPGPE